MDIMKAYDNWADQYDTNENRTRDLEGIALRKTLGKLTFDRCLEIGCGTGKNTEWLITRAGTVVSVDFSEAMLARAIARIRSDRVTFARADINGAWIFAHEAPFDLVVFSLVLEHIEDLDEIFEKLSSVIDSGGYVYIGELHPYKQYLGTKARYEASGELHELTCFTHSVSDFTKAAEKYGFAIAGIDEYFDDDDRKGIPRVLVLLFRKEEDHV